MYSKSFNMIIIWVYNVGLNARKRPPPDMTVINHKIAHGRHTLRKTYTAISEYEFFWDFRNCPLLFYSRLLYYSIQALCDVY